MVKRYKRLYEITHMGTGEVLYSGLTYDTAVQWWQQLGEKHQEYAVRLTVPAEEVEA
jgi:hypothetical protein